MHCQQISVTGLIGVPEQAAEAPDGRKRMARADTYKVNLLESDVFMTSLSPSPKNLSIELS
jgi:hypothetical protein